MEAPFIEQLRQVADQQREFAAHTGNDGTLSWAFRTAGEFIGATPRIIAMSALPGGMVTAMAIDSGAGTYGERGATKGQGLLATGKGAIIGGVFEFAPWLAKGGRGGAGLTEAGTHTVGRAIAEEGETLGTIGIGSYVTARAFGDSPDDSLKEALMNAGFHVAGQVHKLVGKDREFTIRARNKAGDSITAQVDKNGKVTTVEPDTSPDVEVYVPDGDTAKNAVKNSPYRKAPQGVRHDSFEPTNQPTNTSTAKGKSPTPGESLGAENDTADIFGPEDEDKKQGVMFRDGKWQFARDKSEADRASASSSPSGLTDDARKIASRYRNRGDHELADALIEGAKGSPSAENRTPNVTLSAKASRALDSFRAKAQTYLPKWRTTINELGHSLGLSDEYILNPATIKGRERSAEKYREVLKEGGEEPKEALKDTLRASFVIETPEQGRKLRGLISRRFPRIVEEKNRFKKPLKNEYSDVLLHVDLGNGLFGEIQVHVREMLDAKQISHAYYERQRTLDALDKRTPEQDRELLRMDSEQKKLHTAAKRAFTRRTNSSFDALWP